MQREDGCILTIHSTGGHLDEFLTTNNHDCGIDLHAKAMYVCLLDQSGTILVHKNLPTTPEAFLRVLSQLCT